MKSFFFLILSLLSLFSFAQKVDKSNPFFSIRGSVGIPRTTGTQMFRSSFTGIYEANLAAVISPGGKFIIGLGYQNALFKNQKTFVLIPTNSGSISYNTQIIEHGGFLKLGYDHYVSEVVYLSFVTNSGLLSCKYNNIEIDTNAANRPYGLTEFFAPYVQPEFSIHFMGGEKQQLSFSLLLSYTTLFYKFDPKAPRFNHLASPDIRSKRNNYFMNWINIGLGFNILIPDKKKK
ncbi:MAG: hypothetical protein IPM51_07735 [Sphingobacteriaceae bacterium]|nr:hypothetical protein [Sphingobacteriaceae bacterium]